MAGSTEDRQLVPRVVTRFRGLSQYKNIAAVGMDNAIDLLNVITGAGGYLEKLRYPTARSILTVIGGLNQTLVDRIYDFQQANGTRQLFATFQSAIGYYTEPSVGATFIFNLIESALIDQPRFSIVDANNILYAANGVSNFKWTGTQKQKWGIVAPTTAPALGVNVPIKSIKRVANVITVVLDTSSFPAVTVGGFNPLQLKTIPVGNTVKIAGVVTDATANGSWTTTVSGPADYTFSYPSNGANFGPVTEGMATIYTTPCSNAAAGNTDFSITSVQATNNTVTVFFKNNYRILTGEEFVLAGFVAPLDGLNDTWVATAANDNSVSFTRVGPDIPATVLGAGPTIAGGFSNIVGARTWWYSYGNTGIDDESALSPQSLVIPNSNNGLVQNVRAYLNATASPDPQVNVIFWYASLDGGGDPFLPEPVGDGIPTAQGLNFGDGFNDDLLDVTQRGSFINFPPPVARALSKWQNRIYFVPMSDQQTLGYTGYEQILRGRPECNVPPGNFIRLNIGANVIKGHGAIMNGVVIFDSTDRMFMFKGVVEDISTQQPVGYSEQVEEMPWQIGVYSHESIQSTPYGLVWFGSDKTFHKWNGIFYGEIIGPVDIGQNLYPLLRRITKGTEGNVQSTYFNFLERDWYIALIAIDGSATPNRILFFDMTKDESDNLGVWVSDIQCDSIDVWTDANGTKHLLVVKQGIINEIYTDGGSTGGIHKNQTSTNLVLSAFWESGYDGSDSPLTVKMYRFGRMIADQDGFQILVKLLDDETSTFLNPVFQKQIDKLQRGGKFSVNWKARRANVLIQFPNQDVDAGVVQLSLAHIPLSER